jgi:hypothetical protein
MHLTGLSDNGGLTRKINLICLLLAIVVILALPRKKEIWYDETVSVLCSKGISHDSPLLFASSNVAAYPALAQLNTLPNVYRATVNDNANSFVYNAGLHWFTEVTGNSLMAYMLFSKLMAIAAIVAFYFLCSLFFGRSLFTSLAVLFLASDIDFLGMSHEIRSYSMGILFVTLAAIYCYKFLYIAAKPRFLLLLGLFSVAAVLTHFLSVYIIFVFLVALVFNKKTELLSAKNLIAIAIPVALIGLYFAFSFSGLQTMSHQNQQIQLKTPPQGFHLLDVCLRAMKFTSINFKMVLPSFINKRFMVIIGFLFVLGLYFAGILAATTREQKRNLHLLFALGAGSSLFLALLCVKAHHYTALYYRYFSFCLPFASLFVAYTIYVLHASKKLSNLATTVLTALLLLPCLGLFITSVKNAHTEVKYNHAAVAIIAQESKVTAIAVPEWRDAFLIHSFLPQGLKIDYFRTPLSPDFTLTGANGSQKIPVIRIEE